MSKYKLLVYAYRDWSFVNIEPVLHHFEYDRWWFEKGEMPNFNKYDLIITCEPHIEGWRKVYPKIKGKHKILGMQQCLWWDNAPNPNAAWYFDKWMMWGEQQREVCLINGLSDDKMIVTGNPRYDEFFNVTQEDNGYTLILGGGGETEYGYRELLKQENTIFQGHPCTNGNVLSSNTEELIRCASRVIFRDTGAGIIAMIMGKKVKILLGVEKKYDKCKCYNKKEFSVEYKNFVKWAIGRNKATERVRKVIIDECESN